MPTLHPSTDDIELVLRESVLIPRVDGTLALSPDGQVFAAGGSEDVLLYDLAGHQITWFPRRHRGPVISLAWSPRGHVLASGSIDGTVRLWDPLRRQALGQAPGPEAAQSNHLTFSADGTRLAWITGYRTANFWEVGAPTTTRCIAPQGPLSAVSFSPDGRFLAYGGGQERSPPPSSGPQFEGDLCVWDLRAGAPRWQVTGGAAGPIESLTYTSDGAYLVGGDRTLCVWDAHTGKRLHEFRPAEGTGLMPTAKLAALPHSSLVLVGTGTVRTSPEEVQSQQLALFRIPEGTRVWMSEISKAFGGVHHVTVTPTGTRAATISSEMDRWPVKVWDIRPRGK